MSSAGLLVAVTMDSTKSSNASAVSKALCAAGRTLGRTPPAQIVLLQPGVDIRCPHCRDWHAVEPRHESGTAYTAAMLYFSCRGNTYYAGQRGHPSRHESRCSGPRG